MNIGEMLQTCRGNRTVLFPAVPLYTVDDEGKPLLFFESGYNDTREDHVCKKNIDGEGQDVHEVIFPLKMPIQFDGMDMKMKRFAPNEDCWCGMNNVTDIFDLETRDESGEIVMYHATYFERIAIKHARIRSFNDKQSREEAFNKELDDIMDVLTPLYPNDKKNLKELRQVLSQSEPILVDHGRYDQNLFEKFRTLLSQGYFSYLLDDFLLWVCDINARVDVAATPLSKYMYEDYQKSCIDKNTVHSLRQRFEKARKVQEVAMTGYINILVNTIDELQIPNGNKLKELYANFGEFAMRITCAKTTGVVNKYVDTVLQKELDIVKLLSPLLSVKCRIAQKKFMILQKAPIDPSVDEEDVYVTMPEVTQFILDLQPELLSMPMSTSGSMLSYDNMIKERDKMTKVNVEYILQCVKEYKDSMKGLNLDHPEIVSVAPEWTTLCFFGSPYIEVADPVALELFHKYHTVLHGMVQERYSAYGNINLWRYNYDSDDPW